MIDHYQESNPISSLSDLNSVSEAIEQCRRAVVATPVSSQARKDLVNKLIKLRIRYYDLKEREEEEEEGGGDNNRRSNVLEVRGHAFARYSRQVAQEIPWTDPNR